MTEVDFTNAPRIAARAYNGANGKKIAVRLDGEIWLVKFPPSAEGRANELSYSNCCFSEHLGCAVFRALGVEVQQTRLGTYRNGREHVVCACRDFTADGSRLVDFCSVKNSVLETGSGGTGTELDDVLATIDGQRFLDPTVVRKRFWEMFVVDALLGNFDRHNGNWGFLVNDQSGQISLAPVYDCGSCLLPQTDERIMTTVLNDEAELNARIYTFPGSMLKRGGRKINYRDFIVQRPYPDFAAALDRLKPRIAALDFDAILADTPYLSRLQREFLSVYFSARRARLFDIESVHG